MTDRTLVLCKPDAVERKLVGEIVARMERRGLTIVAMELRTIDADLAGRHYEEHQGKPFYADLVAFITRGPLVAMVVEGDENTWQVVRTMMGATKPSRGRAGHDPRRSRPRDHREPGPRVRRPRIGRARDRALLPEPGSITAAPGASRVP